MALRVILLVNRSCLIVATLLTFLGTVSRAESKDPLLTHPDRYSALAEIKGQIVAIDTTTSHLTVKDATQSVVLLIKSDTRIMDTDNHDLPLTSLRPNTPVIVYYNTKEKSAVEVDLQPTLTNAVLGTPVEEHK